MFQVRTSPTYGAKCPYCQGTNMRFYAKSGFANEFQCQKCGQRILYAGKMGQSYSNDAYTKGWSNKFNVRRHKI